MKQFHLFPPIGRFLNFTFLLTVISGALICLNGCEVNDDDKDEDKPNETVSYTIDDTKGQWIRHSLVTSDSYGGLWIYGTVTNQDGNSTLQITLADASVWDTTFSSSGVIVSPEGVVTLSHDPVAHSYLSSDKKLWVGTTARGNMYTLAFDLKSAAGTTYSNADFEGTWHNFYLVSGGQWTGWVRSVMVMNSSGNCTAVNLVKSNGEILNTSGGAFSLLQDGTITIDVDSYHGFMSVDKKLMTATMTDGGGGGGLSVALKEVPGTTYSKADLEGKWSIHTIVSGARNLTEHGIISVDGDGKAVFVEMTRDDGVEFDDPGIIQVSITSNGEVTFDEGFHGFMSADKKLFVGLRNDGPGVYSLVASQKMP